MKWGPGLRKRDGPKKCDICHGCLWKDECRDIRDHPEAVAEKCAYRGGVWCEELAEEEYIVTNDYLGSGKPGLSYRRTKSIEAPLEKGHEITWGETVPAIYEGPECERIEVDHRYRRVCTDWVKVGRDKYLPKTIRGHQVLVLKEEYVRKRDEEAQKANAREDEEWRKKQEIEAEELRQKNQARQLEIEQEEEQGKARRQAEEQEEFQQKLTALEQRGKQQKIEDGLRNQMEREKELDGKGVSS